MYKSILLVAAFGAVAFAANCPTDWDAVTASILDSKQNLVLPLQDGLTNLCGENAGCDTTFCDQLTATAVELDGILGTLHGKAFQKTLTLRETNELVQKFKDVANKFYLGVSKDATANAVSATVGTYNQNLYAKFIYVFQNNQKVVELVTPKRCGADWDGIVANVLQAKQFILAPIQEGVTTLCSADKTTCSTTASFCSSLFSTAEQLDAILADLRLKAVEQVLTQKYASYWISEYGKVSTAFNKGVNAQRSSLPAAVTTYTTNFMATVRRSQSSLDKVLFELASSA